MNRGQAVVQRETVRCQIVRLIETQPQATQREIADQLGVSLGTVHHGLKTLLEKGHVKRANSKAPNNNRGYSYFSTPQGGSHRLLLAAQSIERKLAQHAAIIKELEDLQLEFADAEGCAALAVRGGHA